jgi:flagellar basal-body rod protein FlgC
MSMDGIFRAADVSASGMSGERTRLEVVANNIANSSSTRTIGGGPYRRQDVVFAAVLDQRIGANRGGGIRLVSRGGVSRSQSRPGGVQVLGVVDDASDFHRVHNPGHPDADGSGYVTMPNVNLPVEMVNLITASRAYEANLKALQTFRQMAEQALGLLRA